MVERLLWTQTADGLNRLLGLAFYRNRIYDQNTGRWTQEDPLGVADGLNLYQFNGNDPVAYSDPFGLCIWDGCIVEFVAASAAVSVGIRFIANKIQHRPAGEHVLRDGCVGL